MAAWAYGVSQNWASGVGHYAVSQNVPIAQSLRKPAHASPSTRDSVSP